MRFQSTLPRGERQLPVAALVFSGKFQSTLPRGERLICPDPPHSITAISIHAPTRGATAFQLSYRFLRRISIHAPTRGATSTYIHLCFVHVISIHAPTRGATAILAKNSLSFSAKNHKTIFLQPNCSFSICSFSKKLRYLCIFQSANPSIISCPLPIRAFALLHNQSIVYCNSSVDTYVLYFCLILISQIIKSQTINTLINSVC